VIVISEQLWERRFNRRADIVGSLIPVDGVQRTVVGIAPAAMGLPRLAELWVPIAPYAATQPGWQSRGNNPGLYSFARIKPGLSVEQASADMLSAAKAGDWDQVVKLEGACVLLISQLKQAARDVPLAQDEAKIKSRIMQRILVNDAEVRHLAEPWLPDLHRLLHGKSTTLH